VRIFQDGEFMPTVSAVSQRIGAYGLSGTNSEFSLEFVRSRVTEITPGDCETFYSEREQLKDAVEAGA
jgi:hypothetical protein